MLRQEDVMSVDELKLYSEMLDELAKRIAATVDGLTYEQMNWEPPIHDANSMFVIATHALECTRSWVLHIVAGKPVGRDRPAEFASAGTAADIEALASEVAHQVTSALAEVPAERLDHHSVPPQEVYGASQTRQITGRFALTHMIEHMGIHLGHLQLTRDLALLEVR
jgi:hypothetical protein